MLILHQTSLKIYDVQQHGMQVSRIPCWRPCWRPCCRISSLTEAKVSCVKHFLRKSGMCFTVQHWLEFCQLRSNYNSDLFQARCHNCIFVTRTQTANYPPKIHHHLPPNREYLDFGWMQLNILLCKPHFPGKLAESSSQGQSRDQWDVSKDRWAARSTLGKKKDPTNMPCFPFGLPSSFGRKLQGALWSLEEKAQGSSDPQSVTSVNSSTNTRVAYIHLPGSWAKSKTSNLFQLFFSPVTSHPVIKLSIHFDFQSERKTTTNLAWRTCTHSLHSISFPEPY